MTGTRRGPLLVPARGQDLLEIGERRAEEAHLAQRRRPIPQDVQGHEPDHDAVVMRHEHPELAAAMVAPPGGLPLGRLEGRGVGGACQEVTPGRLERASPSLSVTSLTATMAPRIMPDDSGLYTV